MNCSRVLLPYLLACLALCACHSADEFGDDAYPIPMPGQQHGARGDVLPSPQMFPGHPHDAVTDTQQSASSTDAARVENVSQKAMDGTSRPPVDAAESDTSVPGLPGFCRLEQEGIRAERTGNQIALHFPVSNGFEGPIQPTVEVTIRHVISGVEFSDRVRPAIQPGGGVATVVFDKVEQLQLHARSLLVDKTAGKADSSTPHPFTFETAYRVLYHVDCVGSSADGQVSLYSLLKHADLLVHFPQRLEAGATNKVFGRLVSIGDFSPISGVEALLVAPRQGKKPVPATAVTDKNGVGAFTLPPLDSGEWQLSVTVTTPRGYSPVSPAERTLTAAKSGLTRLWLNKTVFFPGDSVIGQLLMLSGPEFRPLKDTPYTLEVRNPDGLRVFKQQGDTPPFGVISFQMPIARNLASGTYPLKLSASDKMEFTYDLQVGGAGQESRESVPSPEHPIAAARVPKNPLQASPTGKKIALSVEKIILREKGSLRATVLSTAVGGQATVAVSHNGVILDHRVVRLRGQKGAKYSLRLPDRVSGLVTLTASTVDGNGGLQAASQLLFVLPSDGLKLSVAPSQTSPIVPDKVSFEIRTSDHADNPIRAAVGLRLAGHPSPGPAIAPCGGLAMASALASSPTLTEDHQKNATCPQPLLQALASEDMDEAKRALSALELPTEHVMPLRTWTTDRSTMDRQCYQLVTLHVQQRTLKLVGDGQIAATDCIAIRSRLEDILSQGLPDPWGTGLRHNPETDSISSAGPDQMFESWDDCLLPVVLPEQCREKASNEAASGSIPERAAGPPDLTRPTAPAASSRKASSNPQFFPWLVTGEDGKTQVTTTLEDGPPQFQVMAWAVDALGRLAQSTLLLNNSSPLSVRTVLPDAVWLGEETTAKVTVTNHLEEPCDLILQFQGMVFSEDSTNLLETLTLEPGASSSLLLAFSSAAPGPQTLFVSASSSTGFKSHFEESTFVRERGQLHTQVRSGLVTSNQNGEEVQERTKLSFPRRADKRSRSLQIRLFPDVLSAVSLARDERANQAEPDLSSMVSGGWLDLLAIQLIGKAQQDHLSSSKALDSLHRRYQRLVTFRAPKGGMGQWAGENSGGIWPTAAALELLSNATPFMPHIDDSLIPQFVEYLRGMQRSNATWSADPGPHEPTLADLQLSCYVLWVLAQTADGEEDNVYLVQQAQSLFPHLSRQTNRYTDALCLNMLQAVDLRQEAELLRVRILAGLKGRGKRLSLSLDKKATTLLGSGPSQELAETAALLLHACSATTECGEAPALLLQWLMEFQDSKGGWATAPWTTTVALRALSSFKPKGHFMAQGNLAISLNGKEIAIARLSDIQAGRPLLLEPPAAKIKRTNRIALRVTDASPGHLAFNISTSHRSAWPKGRTKAPLKVSLDCPHGTVKAGETFTCSLNLTAPSLDGPRVLHIAVPLDTGVSLPDPGLASAPVRFWQLVHGDLGFIVDRPAPEKSLQIPISLKADTAGEIRLGPIVVTGHFDRSRQGYLRPQRITIR